MRYFEDFPVGQIEEFGQYSMSQEEIIEFASEFDPQFFHVDPEAAKGHFFGGLIASGWHTASAMMRMIADHQYKDAPTMGSSGLDELRWVSPVRPEEVLSVKSEVLEATPHPRKNDRGFIKFSHTVSNQKGEVKLTMISNVIFGTNPNGREA